MAPRRFTSGLVEWQRHDEDGEFQTDQAEVDEATLDAMALRVRFTFDGMNYDVTMNAKDGNWKGKHTHVVPDEGPLPIVGPCDGIKMKSEPGTFRLFGKWTELAEVWKWELVLDGENAPRSTRTTSEPRVPRRDGGKPLDEDTKTKLRAVIGALEELTEGRRVSPQLLTEALRIHASVFRSAKAPRKHKF